MRFKVYVQIVWPRPENPDYKKYGRWALVAVTYMKRFY